MYYILYINDCFFIKIRKFTYVLLVLCRNSSYTTEMNNKRSRPVCRSGSWKRALASSPQEKVLEKF